MALELTGHLIALLVPLLGLPTNSLAQCLFLLQQVEFFLYFTRDSIQQIITQQRLPLAQQIVLQAQVLPAAVCSRNVSFDIFAPILTISLSGGGNSVTEGDSGNTTVTLDFTLDTLPAGSTFLQSTYEVVATNTAFASNPVASQGVDYNFQSTPPFFTWDSSGPSLTQSVSIDIIGDTLAEGDESIYIVAGDIANITGAFTPSEPRFELQIIDDDSAPSVPEVSVTANNSIGEGNGPLVATVSIDQLPISLTNVDLTSVSGTTPAATNDDFEEKTITISFDGPGPIPSSDYTVINSTTVQVNFGITDDTAIEGDENFDIFLSQASGLTISSTDGFQNISIIDNDAVAAPPQINASSQRSFAENSGQASITFHPHRKYCRRPEF